MQPLQLRRVHLRSGEKYQDLSAHIFSVEEVLWICNAVRKLEPKTPPLKFGLVCRRYGTSPSKLRKWLRLYRLGDLTSFPSLLNAAGVESILRWINSEDFNDFTTNEQFTAVFEAHILKATAI